MGPTIFDVELTGQLSKQHALLVNMIKGVSSQVNVPLASRTRSPDYRQSVRLSRQAQLEIVRRYRADERQADLAEAYGVARKTISAIVGRHGGRRAKAIGPDRLDAIIDAYRAGDSLREIGLKFNVSPKTVGRALRENAVGLRKPGGQTRRAT